MAYVTSGSDQLIQKMLPLKQGTVTVLITADKSLIRPGGGDLSIKRSEKVISNDQRFCTGELAQIR